MPAHPYKIIKLSVVLSLLLVTYMSQFYIQSVIYQIEELCLPREK